MDLVAFFQQEFSKVGSVLPGNAGDECFFHDGFGYGGNGGNEGVL
jgi:hypothetical protein